MSRFDKRVLIDPQLRKKIKDLILTYFQAGGLQLQITVVDTKVLEDALVHPEKHQGLIVRIGGFTEYFNRLTTELKQEVIKRTCYMI